MTALELIKSQVKDSRELFESTVADIKPEDVHKHPGGKAFPLGATYAHLIFSEDAIINGMMQKKAPLFASTWKDKTGTDTPMPDMDTNWEKNNAEWSNNVQVDLQQLKKYSHAVYAATDKYINSLKESDLEKEIDMGAWGKRTVVNLLTNFICHHTCSLAGEIAAIKGVLGRKGYPF